MKKKLTLGIFGFGCVGQGLYHVLNETKGIKADIKKICIQDINKKRSIDQRLFTTNKYELLNDPEIDVIVELINDAEEAYNITKEALQNGKSVVSANKKMIAQHLPELIELQKEGNSFLYEGSCCASIPIIRNLEEYYDNDLLKGVEGIFNGTSNYILTKIIDEQWSFEQALTHAQKLGFAEKDPSSDIEGFDSKFKLCIVLLHAFGVYIEPEEVFNYGISKLNDFDIRFALRNNKKIKLVAKCFKDKNTISAYCLPQLLPHDHKLYDVNNEYNGVVLESAFSESQVFIGKGAGSNPTGSAVLSDIAALRYNYQYEYKKLQQLESLEKNEENTLNLYVRYPSNYQLPFQDFISISEEHKEVDFSYIIATISLEALKQATWLKHEAVNILLAGSS